MEFWGLLNDPTIWLGLLTLIALEIVLGIDNLVFIAILADKLPPEQRNRARIIGLSLALIMRIGLLVSISWLVTLTDPFIHLRGKVFSGRDLILLSGGLFLIFKATMELHERLEGSGHEQNGPRVYAGFWPVVTQIVVLDAVFSIDSVITAVGMADELAVMIAAVIIAILVMMLASKPLTSFVNARPTVIILCLGFLLMIGFGLVAEGFGFNVPKGYLYAAIGFSVLIEGFNQFARFNRRRVLVGKRPLRERTAEAVLHLLGGKVQAEQVGDDIADLTSQKDTNSAFSPAERTMIRGVLRLGERSVKAIMTPRTDVDSINVNDSLDDIKKTLLRSPYSRLVVEKGELNEPVGIIQKKDLLSAMLSGQPLDPFSVLQEPLYIVEKNTVMEVLDVFKKHAAQLAFIVDEFGNFEGLVTLTDVLETIAGAIPEEHESTVPYIQPQDNGAYIVDGRTDIEELLDYIPLPLEDSMDFHTVAGLVFHILRDVPSPGSTVTLGTWEIEVLRMEGNRIDSVIIRPF